MEGEPAGKTCYIPEDQPGPASKKLRAADDGPDGNEPAATAGQKHAVYFCTLTKADVKKNMNSFCKLQVTMAETKYKVHRQSGRVGDKNLLCKEWGVFPGENEARKLFEVLLFEETGYIWKDREKSDPIDGKYAWLEMAQGGDVADGSSSSLKPDLHINDLNFDPRQMPLGRLSRRQIQKGLDALDALAAAIRNKANEVEKNKKMSLFYTLYPCNVGGKKNKLPKLLIDDITELKKAIKSLL
ncbi:poly [ADP-ribose] polymerase 2 [Hyalella azteca]|uniref:NAD(+) ADP-ribosyltransferase n=1 Tax=Hyalella azteca TaxID=294128 RepID=A0A8B7N8C2_HYAAZ|nr:poly [ADP-ribose] polymerase 2 [Hyalella azteca]XP_018010092.1 poly [ADP-ribose] polymerase 2 [Hyalella azteca]